MEQKTGKTELMQVTQKALQANYSQVADNYLAARGADSAEFRKEFHKTFSDLLFSQTDDNLRMLESTRKNSLLNAVFEATEIGASFAKREISFIPFQIYKNETIKGVQKKTATGEYDAVLIVDINFQKQQILKLENCKRFFTAQVREGVEVYEDLTTGKYIFEGKNDITKNTIGYFAVFETTEGERYELFMTNAEIVERAKYSPHFRESNYKNTNNNIHLEKVVVRNLLKIIPKVSKQLRSIVGADELSFTDYEIVDISENQNEKQPSRLEAAKKELSEKSEKEAEKERAKIKANKAFDADFEKKAKEEKEEKPAAKIQPDNSDFF